MTPLDPSEVHEVGTRRLRPLVKGPVLTEDATAIARVCHEANRAFCVSLGDESQPGWDDAPEWQQESARCGVYGILTGEITSPEDSHVSWSRQKLDDGWRYGEVKDPEAKTHPCLVPYDRLPHEQQTKDHIFHAIVRAMAGRL